MKLYWLVFSNGFVMKGSVHCAKEYCRINKCSFLVLSVASSQPMGDY
ncbi:hypothetical protein Lw1_gp184 [Escherichia phage Lw1]|uniref:Uncharacterized protein n=1 Tax=Escherichia phage Lw1 TaxID=1307804 RepID=M9UXU1_9CAUD|nr:hypothetical protein Lw1_gp184 [Escherichia phage Lw1]AGJ71590.1 hypothetical protein Lw1_gp184 [Escherichia phage Lw1]